MTRSFFAVLVGSIGIALGGAPSSAQMAYITNENDNTVSVIDTATNTVVGLPISVGIGPFGVAVSPDGSKVYVANLDFTTHHSAVAVIATATNMVTATIPVGELASGIAVTPDGSKVYVGTLTPENSSVSVINTVTNAVVGTIPIGSLPEGVAVTPDGSMVYVTVGSSVSVIDTASNTVVDTIPVSGPFAIAITPDGNKVYVTSYNFGPGVAAIDTATNTVASTITIPAGLFDDARGIAVTPDGSRVYVAIDVAGTTGFPVPGIVSVIDTLTDTVVGSPIPVGSDPYGVAITPDGTKVYVTNSADNTVSVIDTATSMVVAVLPVGNEPIAFGVFIQPRFAGTPGDASCYGKSLSALAQTFSGLNAAAIALGFPTVQGMQTAVNAFCGA